MPIRTRKAEDYSATYFKPTDQELEASKAPPVSVGTASKPVHWNRAKQDREPRAPLQRPSASGSVHSSSAKRSKPIVDGTDSFLGVFLPRPSVNLTRSSFSDIRAADVKATQSFKRPEDSRRKSSSHTRSQRAEDLWEHGLAPDFQPVEAFSVNGLFRSEPQRERSFRPESRLGNSRDSEYTPSLVGYTESYIPHTPSRGQRRYKSSVRGGSEAPRSPPDYTPPSHRRQESGESASPSFPDIPRRKSSSRVGKSRAKSPAYAPALYSSDDDGDDLLPPQPDFRSKKRSSSRRDLPPSPALREPFSYEERFKNYLSPTLGSEQGYNPFGRASQSFDERPYRASSVVSAAPRQSPAPSRRAQQPPRLEPSFDEPELTSKMTTILSRFSSRQMGDHKCQRGYPIAVFCGAQSMDVGSITNSEVNGSYALFFGPGHPSNIQQAMTESELQPSHLQNPKPATVASTGRRAELIATTRALQAIHDLYQGKACAHVCMDSAYVAKAWGSWIPKWEEDGWPGDEHLKYSSRDSRRDTTSYAGSEYTDARQKPRSSKRLADEDLLRQLAAIRRLYARAERRGTGAAHLYLIEKNSNPANKTARTLLENNRILSAASAPVSRRQSFSGNRQSMSIDNRDSGRSRQSLQIDRAPQRSNTRNSLQVDRPSRTSTSGSRRSLQIDPAGAAVPVSRSNRRRSSTLDRDADSIDSDAASMRDSRRRSRATRAQKEARQAIIEEEEPALSRRASVKSAASAVTASEDERALTAVQTRSTEDANHVDADAAVAEGEAEPAKAEGGLFGMATAGAAALVAGVGAAFTRGGSAEAAVPDEPEDEEAAAAAAQEEVAAPVAEPDAEAAEVVAPVISPKKAKRSSKVKSQEALVAAPPILEASPTILNKKRSSKRVSAAPAAAATVDESENEMEQEPAAQALAVPETLANGKASKSPKRRSKAVAAAEAPATLEPVRATSPAPPSPTPSKNNGLPSFTGRIINYSRRRSAASPGAANGTSGLSAPAALALPSANNRRPVSDVTSAELEDDDEGSAAPKVSASAISEVAEEDEDAESAIATPAVTAAEVPRETKPTKTLRKQASLPATRTSSEGNRAPSFLSSKSKSSGRFRSLTNLGGRKMGPAPEDEDFGKQPERKSTFRKRSGFFSRNKKQEAPPPVPATPAAYASEKKSAPAPAKKVVAAPLEESEAEEEIVDPSVVGESEVTEDQPETEVAAESALEDVAEEGSDDLQSSVGGAATPTPATASAATTTPKRLVSRNRAQAPESVFSDEDTPSVATTPKKKSRFGLGGGGEKKAKTPKEPKTPKSSMSFKKRMGNLLTME